MALTKPSAEDFFAFWGEEAETDNEDRANLFIGIAADLLFMATGLEDDPTDPRLNALVQSAILDMAVYLYINRGDLEASYSPFSSERIGSYSYVKSVGRSLAAKITDGTTGVPLFDYVVGYFLSQAYTANGSTSEEVFEYGYIPDRIVALSYDPVWDGTANWGRGHLWQ